MLGSRHAGLAHRLLRVELRALEAGGGGARAEGGDARLLEVVGKAGDERHLGTDHDQVRGDVEGGRDDALRGFDDVGVGGDPGVTGRAEELRRVRRAAEGADDRVLAAAATDDEDPHRAVRAAAAPLKGSRRSRRSESRRASR